MKCPGQNSRSWGPEAIFEATCAHCGAPIEFFKDESSRKCRKCNHKALNPKMDFGCAAYCRFAEQCIGDLSPELRAKRNDMLKDRVAAEVKRQLGKDFRRIGRMLKTIEYADEIGKAENADPAVVTLAAYLSAIICGQPYGTDAGAERLRNAADILNRTGAPAEIAGQVLSILEAPDREEDRGSLNFRCVHDALRLAALQKTMKGSTRNAASWNAEASFMTASGRELAARLFVQTQV